jgi:hypothetical protein
MIILDKLIASIVIAVILIIIFAFVIYFGKALEHQIKKLGWNDSNINNLKDSSINNFKVLLIVLAILSFGTFICSLMPLLPK